MRILRTLLAACLLALAGSAGPAVASPGHRARALHATPVLTGLDNPVPFTFAPSGNIWFGEKTTGRIRIFDPSSGHVHTFFDIPNVNGDGERGLLGLALHPDFPATPLLYAYVTRNVGGGVRNQLVRIAASNGHGSSMKVLFGFSLTSATNHNGGHIAFGPDHRLYLVVGENADPSNSQDLTGNLRGKVLRVTRTGAAAPGNPFGTRIWSYGLRNSIGFDFDPQTSRLWETENGPECTDELNRIVEGGNFAWGPHENCSDPKPGGTNQDGPAPRILPKAFFASTIAPTGMAFCHRCGLGSAFNGTFLFGDCNTGHLHRVRLTSDRLDIASQSTVLDTGNCVYSIETGNGGGIYFSNPGGIFRLTGS